MKAYELNNKITNDKKLALKTMRGLTSYAELLAEQDASSPIVAQVRKIVEELGAYWGVDEKSDWFGKFAKRVLGVTSVNIPEKERIATINGLFHYANEMVSAQGADELERILEIPSIIKRVGEAWHMDKDWIDNICSNIVEMTEMLQILSEMTMNL